MNHKISIIILNRNGRQDTIECLESVFRNDYDNYEVILVDNNSSNESLEKILARTRGEIEVSSKYFPTTTCTHDLHVYTYTKQQLDDNSYLPGKQAIDHLGSNKKLFILKNDDNYGFAEGNNIAMRQSINEGKSHFVCLLNNDTVVDNNFLTALIEDGNMKSDLGMIAPVNYNYYYRSIDFYGGDINWRLGKPYHIKKPNNQTHYQFLTGCCLLIPIKVLQEIGGFDPIYFCYFEDADLSQRVIHLGYNLYLSRNSYIYHKINSSSVSHSMFFRYQFAKNRIIFSNKFNNLLIRRYFFYFIQIIIKSILAIIIFSKDQRKSWFQGIKDAFFLKS